MKMLFKVKNMDISTGDVKVAILNKLDATKYDLHLNDRIKVTNGIDESITAIIDITDSHEIVPKGVIGLFDEILKSLKIHGRKKHLVKIEVAKKPESINLIKKKLNGRRLNYDELKIIISDIVNGKLTSIEMTYFVAASYIKGLSNRETFDLTRAMIDTGEILDFEKRIIMDKHCIGGVAGNRTTPIVVSIIAAAGYTIPKTSSRAITSAAGTADTLEQLCRVNLESEELKDVVKKTNACLVWGGSLNLAPADDKIIKVESSLSVDPTGQLVASVLAKKRSVSANHLLIDIPIGHGAKIFSKKKAKKLKKIFQKIAKMLKIKIKVIITDGSHPIGNGLGPVLEARDILYTLKNDIWGSWELKEKSIYLAGLMLKMAGHKDGIKLAREIFDSGRAYNKFIEIIKAQGGEEIDPDRISLAKYSFNYVTSKSGKITHINNEVMNRICRIAGAPTDPQAGIYLNINIGKYVNAGDMIFTIYSDNKERLEFSKEIAIEECGVKID